MPKAYYIARVTQLSDYWVSVVAASLEDAVLEAQAGRGVKRGGAGFSGLVGVVEVLPKAYTGFDIGMPPLEKGA